MRTHPRPLFYGLAALLLALDQGAKQWAETSLGLFPKPVIPGLLDFALVHNTGVAFGLFAGNNRVWIGVAAALIVLAVAIGRRFDWNPAGTNVLGALLAVGAFGNLIDRIARGHVVDFIDFYWGPRHFPAFNVADSCITVAIAAILIRSLFSKAGN